MVGEVHTVTGYSGSQKGCEGGGKGRKREERKVSWQTTTTRTRGRCKRNPTFHRESDYVRSMAWMLHSDLNPAVRGISWARRLRNNGDVVLRSPR